MPLEGMPMLLEKTLEAHLSQSSLQSWKTKGGPRFSQVTIRFMTENMATGEVQYRRTPPSRLARDNERAHIRQLHGSQQVTISDNDNKNNIVSTQTDVMDTMQVNTDDGFSVPLYSHPQIIADNNKTISRVTDSEMAPDTSINTEVKISSIDTSDRPRTIAKPQGTIADGGATGNTHIGNIASGLPETDLPSMPHIDNINTVGKQTKDTLSATLDRIVERLEMFENPQLVREKEPSTSNDSDSTEGTIGCDGCGIMMDSSSGSVWYRCTECVDVDLCSLCNMKEIHRHHFNQISKFVSPQSWNSTYCDACGLSLNTKDCLYQCQKCEDFCLCTCCCLKKAMHQKHMGHLKIMSVKDYNATIK